MYTTYVDIMRERRKEAFEAIRVDANNCVNVETKTCFFEVFDEQTNKRSMRKKQIRTLNCLLSYRSCYEYFRFTLVVRNDKYIDKTVVRREYIAATAKLRSAAKEEKYDNLSETSLRDLLRKLLFASHQIESCVNEFLS